MVINRAIGVRPRPAPRSILAGLNAGTARLREQEERQASQPPFDAVAPFPEGRVGSFKHSGDLGDLWYSLPVIRWMGRGDLYLVNNGLRSKKADGSLSGFNPGLINMAKPLLEAQPYIRLCKTWGNEAVDVDIDIFRRRNPFGDVNLCELIVQNSGVPFSESARPWLTCGRKRVAAKVFARSPRYRNPSVDYAEIYREHKKDAIFVGLPREHQLFRAQVGSIPHYPVRNFLEMAEIINGSELFIGNQSSPMAIAVGLGAAFLQEVCPRCPNCLFSRDNARYLL